MTPRGRVLTVLAGKKPDRVPFIIWDNKIPSPEIERRLLELGACIIVKSTVWHSHLDGNTAISIVGLPLYREFYLPNIERACRTLHAAGKYAGAHLDGNNRLIVNDIAGTALDFIESFTPPPDCDLPLADARSAWPDKTILSNLPSALHHHGAESVRSHARTLLAEGAGDGRRLILSASEDLPGRGMETLVPLAEEVAMWKL